MTGRSMYKTQSGWGILAVYRGYVIILAQVARSWLHDAEAFCIKFAL